MKSAAEMTDMEILARGRVQFRRRIIWLMALAFVLPMVLVFAVVHFKPDLERWKTLIVCGFVALFTVLSAAIIYLTRRPGAAYSERLDGPFADFMQRQRSLALLGFPLLVVPLSSGIWRATGQVIEGADGSMGRGAYVMLGGVIVVALLNVLVILGVATKPKVRALYNDEFSRHIRSRAVLVGYFVLFVGVAVAFGLGLIEPTLTMRALPHVLLYSAAATCATYAILDLKADRGE